MEIALINMSNGECEVFKDLKQVSLETGVSYGKVRGLASAGVPYVLDSGSILFFRVIVYGSNRGGLREGAFKGNI